MSRPNFPTYTEAAQRGNKGIRIVENIVHDQFGWIFREQEGQKDFGIDAHIELMDGNKVLGRMLAAQIKCGESFFRKKNKDGYIFDGDAKHLNYFLNYPIPVLIILCEPEAKKCWWCKVDPLEMEDTETGWQITVPFNHILDIRAKDKLAKLAGPVKDYLPQLQQYWSLNNLLEKVAKTLCVVIPREDIESGDLSHALSILNRGRITKRLIRSHQDKVDISIFGYENDPRELYEIPEVRKWVRKLDRKFPYWFFFLSKRMPGLKFITFALCDIRKLANGKHEINPNSWAKFLETHFVAMNEICLHLGFSEEEIKELSENVVAYYTGEKPPPSIYTTSA